MSQGQDWSAPGAAPVYQQPPVDQMYQASPFNQAYQQPTVDQTYQASPFNQAYQQPQGQNAYQPVPYQQQPYQQPYQQPFQQGYAGPPGGLVVPKNAGIALLISFFIPGVGSLYAGKTSTGVIILVGYIVSWLLTLIIIGFVGVFAFWVWGMVDAYQAAQARNRARGIVS
jgi:TM2 domain-containing membrane protein YozV